MFTGPMTEARSPCVRFHGVEGSALIQLVNFIYTNEINVTEDNVQTLLPAANLLQLTVVRDICCEFLQSQLHPSNCLGIQRFADLHNCQDLLDFTKRFTEQHFGELLKQDDEFLRLNSNQLIELISSDRLAVSEDQVFEAVLRWIAYDPCERQSEAQNLCSYVRFALLPRDYLVRLSQSDTFLSVNPWCKDYLIEALSYHLLPWDQKLRMTSERTKPRTPIGLPKILLVIGGQAPKAIRSIECFEFQGGSWASLSGDSVQIDNSSSPIQLLCNASTSSLSTSNGCSNPMIPVSNWNSDNVCNLIISDLPSRRCRMGVAVLGGLIYVVGGFNGALRVRSVEVYDPLRNTWHSGPNMECRRATLGVAVLNGLIYAVGGFDGTVGLSSAEVLDIWSGCWRPISSMACQRSSVGAGALNGKLFAVGGYDGTVRRCLSSVECYDPVTNSWSMISEMTCRRSGPSVCELNNRLYAVGGHDGPIVQNSAEVFSPETGNWQRIADLNVRRRNAGLVAHDGFLYVVGGEDGENNLTSIEKYDPTSNTWVLLSSHLRIGRSYAGIAIIERTVT
ncbi:Kelch-like protein 2 [Schistosoma japonicum]|nr:Kelch-like protein 2 [Schistosoma japonicum]KAH8864069.1 Kelch-like protein 2 [Schistosoma japonicum]